jgi:hypothetical protein
VANTSTLIAHAGSSVVTHAQLAALPAPVALGRFHQPVPHVQLVDALRSEVEYRGLTVARESFALQADGKSLFGIMDLRRSGELVLPDAVGGTSLGFRNATDQSLGIKLVAGGRVFVCDNLSLSGDVVALARKNTSGLDLREEVRRGFDRFLQQADQLRQQLQALAAFNLTDERAKCLIFDAFAAAILPSRLFDDVNDFYFHATDSTPDCLPRSAWGLHNACTRAVKVLSPGRQFGATQALGRHFGLTAGGPTQLQLAGIPSVIDGQLGHA